LLLAVLVLAGAASCTKPGPTEEEQTRLYANTFAREVMKVFYLWIKEIEDDFLIWKDTEEPIAKVKQVRYKDASGKDIDRWTMLTDDFASFYGSVSGNGQTYGFDFQLYYFDSSRTSLCAVVTFTYPGSPAEQAGLKRGDVIVEVNGKTIPAKDYTTLVQNELMGGYKLTAGLYGGGTVTMEAREMYEDPVLLSEVFDCGGKKVGYLHYTSFTLDSYKELTEAFTGFKNEGVSELILDLRYNGGGFALAEQFLASMIAPEDVVNSGAVLSTAVYNEELTKYYASKDADTKTYFKTSYKFTANGKSYSFSTANANPGLDKLYAIVSSGSASASEALLCDLYPYMDITLVGEQTHGKYCAGLMMQAAEFYDEYENQLGKDFATEGRKYTSGWGIYVMYSRFADKNGVTRCMPDGLAPDVEAEDNPRDGYALGDPRETMLAKTLALCNQKEVPDVSSRSILVPAWEKVDAEPFRSGFGMMIEL
jgi:C-terminal processing protease CtpA/Prc